MCKFDSLFLECICWVCFRFLKSNNGFLLWGWNVSEIGWEMWPTKLRKPAFFTAAALALITPIVSVLSPVSWWEGSILERAGGGGRFQRQGHRLAVEGLASCSKTCLTYSTLTSDFVSVCVLPVLLLLPAYFSKLNVSLTAHGRPKSHPMIW